MVSHYVTTVQSHRRCCRHTFSFTFDFYYYYRGKKRKRFQIEFYI